MTALPITGLQQSFKPEIQKFEQQIICYSTVRNGLQLLHQSVEKCRVWRRKLKIKRKMIKLPRVLRKRGHLSSEFLVKRASEFLVKFNGAQITFFTLNEDPDNSVIKNLLDMRDEEVSTPIASFCSHFLSSQFFVLISRTFFLQILLSLFLFFI